MIRALCSLPLCLSLATLLAAVPLSAAAQEPVTVIRNGRVLDGSGNPWMSRDMVHVFVNGVPALRDGAFTGQRPGRVLRKTR